MQAVILAAGRGKRLHPITIHRTKAMAPVAGKPIVERVMDRLVANGIAEFILVISPDVDEIEPYFTHKSEITAKIEFVVQPEPLGMGHALLQAHPFIRADFVLSSCDNLIPVEDIRNLLERWRRGGVQNASLATLQVEPENIPRMGIVELKDGFVTHIVEKPSLEDAPTRIGSVPFYIFKPALFNHLNQINISPRGEYELQDAIQRLISREGKVTSVPISSRTDLTTPEDLLKINLHYLSQSLPNHHPAVENARLIDPILIQNNVTIGKNCTLGPNLFIENGCKIGNNVILNNSIVLRNRTIADGTEASHQVFW